ncbi:hypothetical protein [Aureimonas sp. AU20]|nr:hypothetical protein [Aureimonas sp. AU20]
MSEAQMIFDRFGRLLDKLKTATSDVRLDVADEAEQLALDASRWFEDKPVGDAHPIVRTIAERCCGIANSARARV